MKNLLALLLLLFTLSTPVSAQHRVESPEIALAGPIVVDLDAVPTGSLVTMLLRDVMQVPYVIAPEVLSDGRRTSVSLTIPRDKIPETVVGYLRSTGFNVGLQGGAIYVSKAGGRGGFPDVVASPTVPLGSPVSVDGFPSASSPIQYRQPEPEEPEDVAIYVPAYRDPSYFVSVLSVIFPDVRFGAREAVEGDPSQGIVRSEQGPDLLVMTGAPDDLDMVKMSVKALDRPRPMVAVRAVIVETSDSAIRGNALSALLSIGGGDFQVGSYAGDAPASQFARLATGSLNAVLSAVREDTRFRVVATPNVVALSGSPARMNAGSQVPTIGSIALSENGVPIQSVVYRDSGVILEVLPKVRGDLIELSVRQERSSFINTTTGVSDSPTLNTASTTASVVLASGESVLLAGLNEEREGLSKRGIFFGLLGSKKREKSTSELAVVIEAELVQTPSTQQGYFLDADPEPSPEELDVAA